ncbi:hypothetical protein AOLI_G00158220 [Acnodon oligacanthus]
MFIILRSLEYCLRNIPSCDICMVVGFSTKRQDSGYVAEEQPSQETDVICMDSCCPVCGEQFAAEIMPYHASSCGESFPPMNSTMMNRNVTEESTSLPVLSESPETENNTVGLSTSGTAEFLDIWLSKEETDNYDDGFPVPAKCRIAGYLQQFVETGIL